MELTRAEENKNRIVSGTLTTLIFTLLLLFLIWFQLITPNPPFPEPSGGGGQELALGMINMGNDNIDFGSMGSVNDVVTQKEEEVQEENIVTDDNGEIVPLEKKKEEKKIEKKKDKKKAAEKKTEVKTNVTVITPVQPKEKTVAELTAEKYKKNTGKNGGGIGNNEQAGQNGSLNGNPNFDGTGGSGTGNDGGDGAGKGPGSGSGTGGGSGGIGIDLKGRAVVKPPKLPSDTKEEGKVVVDIVVDKEGNVIEASPNGRGTDTNSPALKAKAKQAALATKFNVSGKFEEQNGTITIVFSFQ